MDALWLFVPFVIVAVIIYLTYLIHVFLRKHVNVIAANISTVTIILIVVGYAVFPIFARHGYEPRQTSCASNMKQLGLGFIQYVQDYDNKWPDMGSGGGYWASQIYSYEKSTGVYKCPQDPATGTSDTAFPISYATNANLGSHGGGHLVSAMTSPSSTVLAADFDNGAATNFRTISSGAPSNVNGRGFYGNCNLGAPCAGPTIHDPSIMFLACDGHVKLLRPEKVSPGVTNPSDVGEPDGVHAAGTKAVGAGKPYWLTFSEK